MIFQLYKIKNNERGVAALLTIVIVSAAALIMAYSASLLGMGELDMGYTYQKGGEAFSLADGCMEEALHQVRLDVGYVGETLSLDGNSCIISVVSGGSDRTITVVSTVGSYNKKIEATLTLSGNIITINSWEEKID